MVWRKLTSNCGRPTPGDVPTEHTASAGFNFILKTIIFRISNNKNYG